MDSDLLRAGLRPPLARALAWASGLWALVLLLPVRIGPSGTVWLTDLRGAPSGDLAIAASVVTLLTLAGLSRLAARVDDPAVAWWALAASAVGLAGLQGDVDAGAALLPLLPSGLSRGYLSLILAVGLAAAALRAPGPRRAGVFSAGALLAAAHLYLWPHPFGSVADQAAVALQADLRAGARGAAAATAAALAAAPGLLVLGALAARARFGPRARRAAPYVLAALPALVFVVGLKGAASLGGDTHSLVGLRGALLMTALLIVVALGAGRAALRPALPLGSGRRSLGHAAALLALGVVLSPHVAGTPDRAWAVGPAPAWADTLYAEALPRLFIAAGDAADDAGRRRLAEAAADASRLAGSEPALQEEIAALAELVDRPHRHRRALEHVGARLNAAARQAGLPYYLDLQVDSYGRRHEPAGWMVYAKSYRIVRARRFRIDGRVRAALWLERLDHLNVSDARLGWTRHDAPEGMVVLDVVQDHWREDLAPALAGLERRSRRHRTYARHARALTRDLETALEGRAEPGDFRRLLRCLAVDPGLYADAALRNPRRRGCARLQRALEPAILEVLAEKVETHELQHVAHGGRLAPPTEILDAMRGYDEPAIRFGAAELSAYLAEVAHSPTPKVALTHFLALAQARPRSAEGFAGRVAAAALREAAGTSPQALLRRPRHEVRTAAAAAYLELFDRPVLRPEALDALPSWPLEDGGAPRARRADAAIDSASS